MESFATPYPVIFFDGDQEADKGHVGVHSVLSFKRFQAQLSRLIGIPANQLSAVFVCRRTSKETEKRQRLPINENTNFNIILNQHNPSKERDCHFLVSLKKSKKERKGARRKNTESENVDDDDSTSSRGDSSPVSERPKHEVEVEVDDAFLCEAATPNSVLLDQPLDSSVSSPEPVAVDNNTKDVPEAEGIQINKEEVVENNSRGSQDETTSLPVTRIGGQPLQRSLGEQPKYGPIGSAHPPKLEQPMYHSVPGVAEAMNQAMNQARFKDPIQQQGIPGRPGIAFQRINGVPAFQDGFNMRLLTAGSGRGPNLQPVPNFHHFTTHFQQQQRYLNLQPRFTPRMDGGGHDSYGRESEQACQDCLSYKERNIRPPPFHCCINDRITSGFRGPSPAGPIERPIKRQVKAAA